MKKIILFRLLLAGILFGLWYICYPHTIQHLEETTFYANIPDYFYKYHSLPTDFIKIIGNYIAQFYQYHWVGAILQTIFVLFVLAACDIIFYRLLGNRKWLWISFIPSYIFAIQQTEKVGIEFSITWVIIIWILAIISLLIRKVPIITHIPQTDNKYLLKICEYSVPIICILLVIHNLLYNPNRLYFEKMQRIEHAAVNHQWDVILKEIPNDIQPIREVQFRYFLLALSEKELLGEYLFHFPIRNEKDFLFDTQGSVPYRFNSLFYWNLGLPNEAIRFAFQENQAGVSGDMTFAATRRLVDWYMQKGDIRQAKFYLNILSHSTCHKKFIRTRNIFLQQTTQPDIPHRVFFINAKLSVTALYLLELDCTDQRALNYLLCCLLLEKELDSFYSMFRTYWSEEKAIPTHYAEALLMLSDKYPEILSHYDISRQKQTEYKEYSELLQKGSSGLQTINMKYRNTFWRYMLFNQQNY
ncbi:MULTISPECIES: DUF6057 family protein [Bacteroides]|jgi:hypothetical protein|uniref:DUF6057 family protein n=1 Tax=Bacteroides TaxID=816 RepID=UPI0011AF14B4|nr:MULTISPECIES: DUF6057 family protein [Bacteroides]